MRYWIGLGSNLGDKLATLRGAARALERRLQVVARSRVYAASAVGGPPQPTFLNAALLVETDLDGAALLALCQEVEVAFGRNRESEVRWGPRTLDVDVLLAGARGEITIATPDLEVPHPRMHERGFALAPLLDLDATLIHPTLSRPIKALLTASGAHGNALAPTGDLL